MVTRRFTRFHWFNLRCIFYTILTVINTAKVSILSFVLAKTKDYGILMKFKLSLTVVFSAVMAYMIALDGQIVFGDILVLFFGGLFTSGAASGLNQVLEKDFDSMMKRTENRQIGRAHV